MRSRLDAATLGTNKRSGIAIDLRKPLKKALRMASRDASRMDGRNACYGSTTRDCERRLAELLCPLDRAGLSIDAQPEPVRVLAPPGCTTAIRARHRQSAAACRRDPGPDLRNIIDVHRQIDTNAIIAQFAFGGMAFDVAEKSMRLFAAEVLPKVKAIRTMPFAQV